MNGTEPQGKKPFGGRCALLFFLGTGGGSGVDGAVGIQPVSGLD